MTTYLIVLTTERGDTFTYSYATKRGALAAVEEATRKHHKAGHTLGNIAGVTCEAVSDAPVSSDSEGSPHRMTDHHFVQAHRDAAINSAGRATTTLRKRCVYASCQDLRAFRSWLDLAEHYLAVHERHAERKYRLTNREAEGAQDFIEKFAPTTGA